MKRTILIALMISMSVSCGGPSRPEPAAGASSVSTKPARAELGAVAPPLFVKEWINKGPIDLAASKGKKAYIIDFWATWCVPCQFSIPRLEEIQLHYGVDNIEVVGVSNEAPEIVREFFKTSGLGYNYALAVDDDGKTTAAYRGATGVTLLPWAYLINKEGYLVWHGPPLEVKNRDVTGMGGAGSLDGALQRLFPDYPPLPRAEFGGRADPDRPPGS